MNAIAQYLQWLAITCTGLAVVFMVAQALLITRPRRLRGWVLVLVALVDLVAVLTLYWYGNIFLSMWWMAGLLLAGVIAGWFAGRSTKTAEKDGHVYGKLSPAGPWLVAIALSASVGTLFFASVGVFAASVLFSLFAVGMLLGQAVSAAVKLAGAKSHMNVPVSVATTPEPGA